MPVITTLRSRSSRCAEASTADRPARTPADLGSLGLQEIAYYSKFLFNLAMIHAIRGQHERAIADFARSIALDPFFAVAHFQLGVSAFLIGQFVEAKKSFDRALAVSQRLAKLPFPSAS